TSMSQFEILHTKMFSLYLHDDLPISDLHAQPRLAEHQLVARLQADPARAGRHGDRRAVPHDVGVARADPRASRHARGPPAVGRRSEEHTSELQSRVKLVCRDLLVKKQ